MFYNLLTFLKSTFAIHIFYWITTNQIHHLVKRGSINDVNLLFYELQKVKNQSCHDDSRNLMDGCRQKINAKFN